MAFNRFNRLPLVRQRQILSTAAEAFAEHGYERASYNALLAKLGLSKSQAYYYFADKADLFVTACAACYEEYYAQVEKLEEPATAEAFWEMVVELNRIGVWFQKTHPTAAKLSRAIAESPLREELGRVSLNRATSSASRHKQWIELGQRLGAVRTDLPTDLMIALSMGVSAELDAWFAPRAADASDADLDRVSTQFADISRRLFEAARGEGRST